MFDKKLKALKDSTINPKTKDIYTVPEIMQELSISYATWYRYLDGSIPNGENLVRLAALFGVTSEYLVNDDLQIMTSSELAADEIMLRSQRIDPTELENIIEKLKTSLASRGNDLGGV